MKYINLSFFLILLLLLFGCNTVNVSSTLYTDEPFERIEANDIRVYRTTLPDQRYEEIGMIQAEGARRDTVSDLIEAMRERASEMGAEAIILQEMGEPTRGVMPMGNMYITIQGKVYNATAIRFIEE